MAIEDYENIVIGSGEAGKYMAWTLGKQGQKTLMVERLSVVGGACPNFACLPSKNVVHSARVAAFVKEAAKYGVHTGDVTIDMAGVIARKRAMVADLQTVHLNNFKASGVEICWGEGRFVGQRTVAVKLRDGGERTLRGQRIFLDVGSRAQVPNVPGLAEAQPMTHVQLLELDHLPAHLVILGGGYVGLEFAQAMRRFGSRVTVIVRGARLFEHEDDDVAEAMLQLLRDEGVDVRLNASLASVAGRSGQNVTLTFADGQTLQASDLLVATGRLSNADSLNAAAGGVELDAHQYVRVNDRLETSAPGVWAMGDCAGSPKFTHASYDDFRIVRDNLGGANRSTAGRLIPSVLFTDPELAHVGLTEKQCQAQDIPYRIAKLPTAAILRTRTVSAPRGFIKAIVAAVPDDRILGFTAFGVEASELMAAVQTAMRGNLPYTLVRDTAYAHPTIAEGLVFLFANLGQPSTGGH